MNPENINLEPTITFSENTIIEDRNIFSNCIIQNLLLTICGIIFGSIIGTIIIFMYKLI